MTQAGGVLEILRDEKRRNKQWYMQIRRQSPPKGMEYHRGTVSLVWYRARKLIARHNIRISRSVLFHVYLYAACPALSGNVGWKHEWPCFLARFAILDCHAGHISA